MAGGAGGNAAGRVPPISVDGNAAGRVPKISIDGQAAQTSSKKSVTNDEVAAILKGLKLDREFFQSRIHPTAEAIEQPDGDVGARRNRLETGEDHDLHGDVQPGSLISSHSGVRKKARPIGLNKKDPGKNIADFDIYLNEAVIPVLAQSLDSLCRQLNRMDEQGENLDPKVRARFNPLTWLAQQLLRRHPKCARTPRRQALYKNFQEWADQERGRRALLRSKDVFEEAFNHFALSTNKGGVLRTTIRDVIADVDERLVLNGALKENNDLLLVMGVPLAGQGRSSDPDGGSPVSIKSSREDRKWGAVRTAKRKRTFFQGEIWTFPQFWENFTAAVMKLDVVVPYSIIERGRKLIHDKIQASLDREEALRKEAELRREEEEQEKRQSAEYATLREEIMANEFIRAILDANKILTGDDVRPGDAGYEFEVPPKGLHCELLAKFMGSLGFKVRAATKAADEAEDTDGRWWTAELAGAWSTLQEMHDAELTDGVVERDTLEKVLTEPGNFMDLKRMVEDELTRGKDADEFGMGVERRRRNSEPLVTKKIGVKPSLEALCVRLGMTMSRLKWLHELFETFLPGASEWTEEDDQPPPSCGYPENPAFLTKEQMRELMKEVKPDIAEDEFGARFQRIDEDSSGKIEFDEFVTWVREDEVKIVGASTRKYNFEELAGLHNQHVEVIRYLYSCFEDQLPEGEEDHYPDNCVAMPKARVKTLANALTPGTTDEDFETKFRLIDVTAKEACDFDEFLEVLDMAELPPEILTDAVAAASEEAQEEDN